jgi:hypothetical protein
MIKIKRPGAVGAAPGPKGNDLADRFPDISPAPTTQVSGRSPSRAAPPIERRTHIALADLLRIACRPDWFWSHIPSGEHRSEKTGALLKRMGTQRGMLDFLLIGPDGQHHWLELKRANAPLSESQTAFIAELDRRGVPYAIARSFDSAVTQLKQWGVLPRVT